MKVITYLKIERWDDHTLNTKIYLHSLSQIPLTVWTDFFFKGKSHMNLEGQNGKEIIAIKLLEIGKEIDKQ